MSGWFLFAFVVLAVFGQPSGSGSIMRWAYVVWALVLLAMIAAIVVGEMGWPS